MDLSYGEEYEGFREEIRTFLKENKALGLEAGAGTSRASGQAKAWQLLLIEHGYTCRTIPKEYGGYGAEPDMVKNLIISEEFSRAKLPKGFANQGISMLVPTLLALGSDDQKERFVESTIKGDTVWCQGYSEPGAGSDLASLQTSAVVDGDEFVINGQKIWTSSAHFSDMIFILVRTEPDAPKHSGISYLLVPMDAPGIEVKPLVSMTGTPEFNEVFFTDVRVKTSEIVGKRGEGWQVANATLKHERGMLGNTEQLEALMVRLTHLMQEETLNGQALITYPVYRDRLLKLQSKMMALKYHGLRVLSNTLNNTPDKISHLIIKLTGTHLANDINAMALDMLNEVGTLYGEGEHLRAGGAWQYGFMYSLGLIIGGGTSQIQKNIISERGLDMPREPKTQSA